MTDRKLTAIDWRDLPVFLALGRHRSLSAAARALGVNHATIARRIRSLEGSLGERLVERRPEGYALTPAGEKALSVAADMEAAAQGLVRRGEREDDPLRGHVRITAPPALAQGFLMARLAEISVQHPALDIDVATDLRLNSLHRHEADIAVRVGVQADVDLIAKRVGSIAYGFYGLPRRCEEVESGGPPTFVSFNEEGADLPGAAWLTKHFGRARVALRAGDHVLQSIAALNGAGLALMPHYLGRQLPGLRLCRLGPLPPAREISLLVRRQDRTTPVIGAVKASLSAAFKADEDLFSA